MKVSHDSIEGLPALEESLSRKVEVLLRVIGWLDEMDLSAKEKSSLLRLIRNMCLSLSKNQEFLVPTDSRVDL